MKVTIVERPRSTNLVTLEKVKQSLGLTTTDIDVRLTDLIEDVSSAFVEYCGKHFARSIVTEFLEGYGDKTLSLARTPVVRVDEVRFDSSVLSSSGYDVSDPQAGFLYRLQGDVWNSTQPRRQWIEAEQVNMPGEQSWNVDYMGGYLMPSDDFTASGTVAVDAADSSFTFGAVDDKWPLLTPGESVRFSGFANAANNGLFTVVTRTDTKITVIDTLITEAAAAVVTVRTNLPENEYTLPRDLVRVAIGEIRDRFMSEQRDGTITSEKIGDWSGTYGSSSKSGSSGNEENTFGFSQSTVRSLTRYVRVM